MGAFLTPDWPAPPRVRACSTLRHGAGASPAPFDDFNLGLRCGDEPANARENRRALREQLAEIDEMTRIARGMLSDALDAFVRGDSAAAQEVLERDDRVDRLHESIFRILVTHMMEDPRRIGPAMSLFLVSRNLERIADLATNIGEDVVYLVEARNIRHGGRGGA